MGARKTPTPSEGKLVRVPRQRLSLAQLGHRLHSSSLSSEGSTMTDVDITKEMAARMVQEAESKLTFSSANAQAGDSSLNWDKMQAMMASLPFPVHQSPLVPAGTAILINPAAAGLFDMLPEMPMFERHAKPQMPVRITPQRVRRRQEEIMAARSNVLLAQSEAIRERRAARHRIRGTP